MAKPAKKIATRGLTAKERYDILVQFKKQREAGKSNKDASDMLGIPFITLYTWLRDELWKDARHTHPPLVLAKRGRPVGRPRRANKRTRRTLKAAPEAQPRPKTILRKAAEKTPPKNFTPAKDRKPYLKGTVKKDEEQSTKPEPVSPGKPIIVRTPNGCEVEFADLNAARDFAQSYNG